MSFQAMTWALRQHVPDGEGIKGSTAKFVLVLLANYADKDGLTFVEAARIGREAELSERVVRRAFEWLSINEHMEYAGFRKGDSGRAKGWRLAMPGADTVSEPSAAPPIAAGQGGADTVSKAGPDMVSAPAPGGPDIRESMSGHGVTVPPIPPQQEVDVLRRPEPKSNRETAAARPRNVAFDTLAEVSGRNPEALTKSAGGEVGTKLAEIRVAWASELGVEPRDVDPARLAAEIRIRMLRLRAARSHWSEDQFTPSSLAKWWDTLAHVADPPSGRGVVDWSRYDDESEMPA